MFTFRHLTCIFKRLRIQSKPKQIASKKTMGGLSFSFSSPEIWFKYFDSAKQCFKIKIAKYSENIKVDKIFSNFTVVLKFLV